MKTKIYLLAFVMLFSLNFASAQIHKYAPEVVLIGVGEKNASFDEARFPDLKFYYTPELSSADEGVTFTGSPEFVKTIWNDKSFKDGFMLFDKNGVCVTMGYDINRQNDIGGRMCTDKKTLNDHLRTYVKKGKTGKASSKDMKMKKSDFMLAHKMPEYDVNNSAGDTVKVSSICESGKPVLVIFFNIPKAVDLNAANQAGNKKTGRGFLNAMKQGAGGAKQQKLFVELESEFFQYDARQK